MDVRDGREVRRREQGKKVEEINLLAFTGRSGGLLRSFMVNVVSSSFSLLSSCCNKLMRREEGKMISKDTKYAVCARFWAEGYCLKDIKKKLFFLLFILATTM